MDLSNTFSQKQGKKSHRKPKQGYKTRAINRKLTNRIDVYSIIQIIT